MNTSALYNLYTEDYSVDSIRKSPVTIHELIHEGVSVDAASLFIELSEKLFVSFLKDTMNGLWESEKTVSIWKDLHEHCIANHIAECGVSSSFCLHGYDIVLSKATQFFLVDFRHFNSARHGSCYLQIECIRQNISQ